MLGGRPDVVCVCFSVHNFYQDLLQMCLNYPQISINSSSDLLHFACVFPKNPPAGRLPRGFSSSTNPGILFHRARAPKSEKHPTEGRILDFRKVNTNMGAWGEGGGKEGGEGGGEGAHFCVGDHLQDVFILV